MPAVFGKRKLAEAFAKAWRRHVGSAKLVYLRDAAGRRLLLRARTRSLAAGMSRAVGAISAVAVNSARARASAATPASRVSACLAKQRRTTLVTGSSA